MMRIRNIDEQICEVTFADGAKRRFCRGTGGMVIGADMLATKAMRESIKAIHGRRPAVDRRHQRKAGA